MTLTFLCKSVAECRDMRQLHVEFKCPYFYKKIRVLQKDNNYCSASGSRTRVTYILNFLLDGTELTHLFALVFHTALSLSRPLPFSSCKVLPSERMSHMNYKTAMCDKLL